MKLNKYKIFIYIWLVHTFVYYLFFMFLYRVGINDYDEFYYVFLGFLIGIIGGPIKQLPFFFIIPLLLMLVLVKMKFDKNWFIAYSVSICFAYLAKYIWLFYTYKKDIMLGYPKEINTIFLIIPSLIVSIICNWLIFKRIYKRLGV